MRLYCFTLAIQYYNCSHIRVAILLHTKIGSKFGNFCFALLSTHVRMIQALIGDWRRFENTVNQSFPMLPTKGTFKYGHMQQVVTKYRLIYLI